MEAIKLTEWNLKASPADLLQRGKQDFTSLKISKKPIAKLGDADAGCSLIVHKN